MSNGNKSQNKITYLIMIICIWGGYLFGDYYFQITENTVTIYEYDSSYPETPKLQKPIIMSKPTNKPTNGTKINIIKSSGIGEVKNKEGKQPIYTGSSRLSQLVGTGIAESIIKHCKTARDEKHCQKSILGVATAESSLFKKCYNNNCFGLKLNSKLAGYKSIDESIQDRVKRYNKVRYTNHNGTDFLKRSRYCYEGDGGCKYRIGHFNNGFRLLD